MNRNSGNHFATLRPIFYGVPKYAKKITKLVDLHKNDRNDAIWVTVPLIRIFNNAMSLKNSSFDTFHPDFIEFFSHCLLGKDQISFLQVGGFVFFKSKM